MASNSVTFQVNAPTPAISSLTPSSMIGSTSSQTLTINGTNFLAGLSVVAGYSGNFTTYTGTQITSISATQIVLPIVVGPTARTWSVTVSNLGSAASNTITLPITAPVTPVIATVSPNPMTGSASNQTLTINGTGFQSGTGLKVVVGYTANSTTLTGSQITSVTATQIQVTVNVGTTTRPWTVSVTNPSGMASNSVTFPVNAPTPAISSLTPSSMIGSTSSQTLTINGTNFLAGLSVVAGYSGNFTTYTGTQITSISATQIVLPMIVGPTARTWSVTVTNLGSAASNTITWPVTAPVTPVIATVSPSPMTGSASPKTLTINGTGFQSGLRVVVGYNGTSTTLTGSQITSVTATQIQVPIIVGTTARQWTVAVIDPSGMASNSVTFQVNAP
jgi:Fe-S cluster assembly scaffold protein SufB